MGIAVAIIAILDGQVLLVRNQKRSGSIEIPGGALRPIEGFVAGAIRELHEECGLSVTRKDLVTFHGKEARGWYVQIFRALRWSGELTPGDDVSDCFWGSPDLILEGQRPEDYQTVCGAMHQHKAAFRQ